MRILLVEDEDKVARFVSVGLKAERFAVDRAKDGKTGLQLAEMNSYDLLVVDLMLPELSGTDLIAGVRRRNDQVPIIVLTARDALDDKIRNFEAGADDYLTKPFAFAELAIRIKALMRRGPINRSDTLKVADLEIDRVSHQVTRGGIPIKLTSKEYGLLEYLAASAGRVLTRTMIIEHVWDQSFEGLTNIVDVYIRQIRLKIDEPFAKALIHTVRSVGYALRDEEAQ